MPFSPPTYANNVVTVLVGGQSGGGTPLLSGDTSMIVGLGVGAKFPATFPCTAMIGTFASGFELVACTARPGNADTFTITRAQEGTTAPGSWPVNTPVELIVSSANLTATNRRIVDATVGTWNVRNPEYGAVGDGVTDDSAAINAARAACNAAGGGIVYWPTGTYITQGNNPVYSNVIDVGDGPQSTIIKLKNAANADIFNAGVVNINLSAAAGTSSSTAAAHFGFRNLTLDGNYTNQTSGGIGLQVYGYGFILENFWSRNCYSGGIRTDYNGSFPSDLLIESTWINVRSYGNRGATTAFGIECGGPHDSRWTNVLSYYNNSNDIHCGPNFGGLQAVGCHGWNSGLADTHSCTWLQEASLYATGCEAEGSPYAQLVILANGVDWVGGSVYSGGLAGYGIQIGQQASLVPFTNSTNQSGGSTTLVSVSNYKIDTIIQNITHATGALFFSQDAGGVIDARVLAASGANVLYTGTIGQKTTLRLNTQGYNSPTPQMLFLLGGGHSGQGGPIAYATTASADPGNNGTIATTASPNILLNPAAAETGLILGSGQFDGQIVTLVNLSAANSLTFAASGTSHVADGVSDVIAANSARRYIWYSLTALWYKCV